MPPAPMVRVEVPEPPRSVVVVVMLAVVRLSMVRLPLRLMLNGPVSPVVVRVTASPTPGTAVGLAFGAALSDQFPASAQSLFPAPPSHQ